MSRKKILIINPGELFPKIMAFQDRVFEMIKCLNQSHEVDVICLYRTQHEKTENLKELRKISNHVYMIKKPNTTLFTKYLFGFISILIEKIFIIPREMIYPNWPSVKKKIKKIINGKKYHIIQIETWWQGDLFYSMPDSIIKAIDTHDVLYEKRELEMKFNNNNILSKKNRKFLQNYRNLELRRTGFSNLIISISDHDEKIFKGHFATKKHILIPTGQNLDHFINFPTNSDGQTILFYGSMAGEQNIIAFWRLYHNILPQIKKNIPDIKLIVLGSNPPKQIQNLHNNNSIIVTGYVKDVREFIAQATLMLLPLSTGGGFRSRIVEVMAMGIPVIGTMNALKNTGMINGVHGYITDSDEQMASFSIDLINDQNLKREMGNHCIEFIKKNYSIEKTYNKLSNYYFELKN